MPVDRQRPSEDARSRPRRAQRVAALSSALSSRVAWDRVLRQISLVLPEDVWLTSLTSRRRADASAATGAVAAAGASFTLTGATYSQSGVARFLSRLARRCPTSANVQLPSSPSQELNEPRARPVHDPRRRPPPGSTGARARRRPGAAIVKRKLSTPRTLARDRRRRVLVYAARLLVPARQPEEAESAALKERDRRAAARGSRDALAATPPHNDDTQPIAVADIFRLAKAMPSTPDMPGILLELSRIAEETGIEFQSITPQPALRGRRRFQIVPIDARLRRQLLRALRLPLPAAHARRRCAAASCTRPGGCSRSSRASTSPSRERASRSSAATLTAERVRLRARRRRRARSPPPADDAAGDDRTRATPAPAPAAAADRSGGDR